MGLFDFLRKPESKGDTQKAIKEANKAPKIMLLEENGKEIRICKIEIAQRIRHRDGSISCLMTARLGITEIGNPMMILDYKPICFEIPEGRWDLIKEIVKDIKEVDLNNRTYKYLGRALDHDFIDKRQPSQVVLNEINKYNVLLAKIEERKKEKLSNIQGKNDNELKRKRAGLDEKLIDVGNKIKQEFQDRIENPWIKGGKTKNSGEFYDGVNLNNGEILRLRNVRKIAKDTTGRYIYTARIDSTPNKDDVELLSGEIGYPVVFTVPFRLNDIINTEYDVKYKKQLEMALLRIFSKVFESNIDLSNGIYDIGGINKDGETILNSEKYGVSRIIISEIAKMQREYASKKEKEDR